MANKAYVKPIETVIQQMGLKRKDRKAIKKLTSMSNKFSYLKEGSETPPKSFRH